MAAMEKNDKTLKSSSEREQNQLAGSAEREKIKGSQNLNVPNLRFPEFSGEWEKCTLGDITTNFSLRNKEQIQYPMFSVTNNRGFVPQSEQFEDREMIGEDIKAYKIIHEGDFAYNPARINVGSIAKYGKTEPCMISSLYVCFKAHSNIDTEWMMQLLKTPKMNFYYNVNGEGGVRVYLFYPNFARIRTSYPSLVEQQKIAAFLRLLDQRIETQKKIIEDLKKLKDAISVTHLKSLSLCDREYRIGDLCTSIAAKQYICQDISTNGAYPIIQQGEHPIAGYTDSMPFMNYDDVILFGDHTLSIYRPGTPFLISTDGIKILTPNDIVSRDYLYYLLDTFMPEPEGYKRHYNIIKDIWVSVPNIDVQKTMVDKLLSIDLKIGIETRLLELQLQQKQYLLSQIFI